MNSAAIEHDPFQLGKLPIFFISPRLPSGLNLRLGVLTYASYSPMLRAWRSLGDSMRFMTFYRALFRRRDTPLRLKRLRRRWGLIRWLPFTSTSPTLRKRDCWR